MLALMDQGKEKIKLSRKLGATAQAFSPSTREAEVGESLEPKS